MADFPRAFEFRRADGVTYRFERTDDGRWKRIDLDLWCERNALGEWVTRDAAGAENGWPNDATPGTQEPPAGKWRSSKAGKGYAYDLVYLDAIP